MTPIYRNRKVLVAVAAIVTIYVAKLTGLDDGIVDQLLDAIVDALATPEVAPEALPPVEAAPAPEGL